MSEGILTFLAAWWVGYVALAVTTLLGGILAVHNPPREATFVRWSYGSGFVFLFILGFFVMKAQHIDSLKQTSLGAAEARKDVHQEIETAVKPYQERIDDLSRKLAQQSQDVRAIKGSNIVTGKKPIPVQVTNSPNQDAPLPTLNWTQEEAAPENDKPITLVRFRTDGYLKIPAFMALCDRACKAVEASVNGMSQVGAFLDSRSHANSSGVIFALPRPLPPATDGFLHIASTDDKPVKVTSFRILKEVEIPIELR